MQILVRADIIFSTILIILAYFVFSKNPKSVTNKILSLFSLTTAVWLVLNIFPLSDSISLEWKLIFIRIVMALASLQMLFLYLFSENFPNEKLITSRKKLIVLSSMTIILIILSLSPLLFVSVSQTSNLPSPIPGIGMLLYLPTVLLLLILSFSKLVKILRHSEPKVKKQVWLVLLGMGLMLAGIILFNFIFVVIFNIPKFVPYGIFCVCFFILFSSIAILRYELLNVRIIVLEGIIVVIDMLFVTELLIARNLYSLGIFIIVILASLMALRSIRKEDMLNRKLGIFAHNLKHTNEELKNSIQERNNLYANISHELKTPITVLKGNIEIALANASERSAIDHELERMSKLTSELLELSKADSGEILLRKSQFSFIELMQQIEKEVSPLLQEKNIAISKSIPNEIELDADREKMYTLFLNLLVNAIKYNKTDGKIFIRATKKGNTTNIQIEDTGIGISEEHLPHIFERFYRVDKQASRKMGGTGLGLAIVKLLAELHGGSVIAESKIHEGTKFTVILPTSN